jgi:phosphate-selective porin OprO/OprP
MATLAVTFWALSLAGAHAEQDTTLKVYWQEGLRFETADKQFQMKIGGRLQNDWVAWSGRSDVESFLDEDIDNGTEFRRARLYISGLMYDHVVFMAEYDFAGGESAFKDTFVGLKDAGPVDLLRVGHFKEPFSLEELTSDNFTTFLERSLPNAFAPSRQTGFGLNQVFLDNRMTVAVAGFLATDEASGDSTGDNPNFAGRITGLPWWRDGGEDLVHLGFSYFYSDPNGDTARVRQRPEVHLAPRFVDTDDFGAEDASLYDFELAAQYGPYSLQGEYMLADVSGKASGTLPDPGNPLLSGWYAYASWVITGEHRIYKQDEGAFSGVNPKRNFLRGGPGAFELAVRYSNLDLDDEDVSGGTLDDVTVGLIWYLNPNARVMFNYVHAMLDRTDATDSIDDSADAFTMRFQFQL